MREIIKEFEPNQYDPRIAHIVFAKENGQFIMEILATSEAQAVELEGNIFSARRLYDMTPPKNVAFPIKQNFEIERITEEAKVKISGNLFNAFGLLRDSKLITTPFAESILESAKIKAFLDSTKNFVLPVIESSDEDNSEEGVAALQQSYLAALKKLGPEQLQRTLDDLSKGLASEHINVEIRVEGIPRSKSPAVH